MGSLSSAKQLPGGCRYQRPWTWSSWESEGVILSLLFQRAPYLPLVVWNLFQKGQKELRSVVHSVPCWKLFDKVPPRENLQKIQKPFSRKKVWTGRTYKSPFQSLRHKNFEFEPPSTTFLILEYGPSYDWWLLLCPVEIFAYSKKIFLPNLWKKLLTSVTRTWDLWAES